MRHLAAIRTMLNASQMTGSQRTVSFHLKAYLKLIECRLSWGKLSKRHMDREQRRKMA